MKGGLAASLHFRLRVVVDHLPAAPFDTAQRRAGSVIRQPLGPKAAPVVGHNLVQRIDNVIKGVRLYHRRRAGRTMEKMAEVIDGFLVLALPPDDDVDP